MRLKSSMMNATNCVVLGASLAAALAPSIAGATLGEPEISVQGDGARLRGSVKVTEFPAFRQHEIQLPSGTRMREFSGPDGKVFAVAWNGPAVPNLRQTLGQYFDVYVTAAKGQHSGHSRLQIQQGGLIVESAGHMRAFAGRAYLPQAVPSAVNLASIR